MERKAQFCSCTGTVVLHVLFVQHCSMKKAAAGSAPKPAAVAAAAAACDAAFVYVCCKCAHIIGDSESLVHAEGVEEAVTLRCKCLDIMRDSILKLLQHRFDLSDNY
jgi:hypothetical protein